MKYITLILVLLTLTFTSCKRTEVIEQQETNTANQQLQTDDTEDEVSNIADACMTTGSGFRTGEQDQILSTCATVTKDTLGPNHYKVTVDFGPVNCASVGVKQRRGKILIDIVGNYKDSGSVRTVTFDNFYRNDNKVEGTRIITNAGRNSSGQYQWYIAANDMKITRVNGSYHTWNSTRTRTMTAGYLTPTRQDDEYQIVGFQEGEGVEIGCIIWKCVTKEGITFNCRPKGTHEARRELFKNAQQYVGKKLTVRFQELSDDLVPRFPVGITIRDYE